MAEKKIGDVIIGGIFLLFFLGMYSAFFISADDIHGLTDSIGSDLEGINNQSFEEYTAIETQLEDDTYNLSTFTIRENQFIDTRGTSQDFIMGKDMTNTNKNFLVNVSNIIKQPVIIGFLIFLVITVTIILFLGFWKGRGV